MNATTTDPTIYHDTLIASMALQYVSSLRPYIFLLFMFSDITKRSRSNREIITKQK